MSAGPTLLDTRGWADSSITAADLAMQAALVLLVALVAPRLIHHRHAALRVVAQAALLLMPAILLLYSYGRPELGRGGPSALLQLTLCHTHDLLGTLGGLRCASLGRPSQADGERTGRWHGQGHVSTGVRWAPDGHGYVHGHVPVPVRGTRVLPVTLPV